MLSFSRCGHCKSLAPEYEKAATALLDNDPPVPLAKVDCPANSGLCSQFGVSGYPTLKIFRDGQLSGDYQGPRNAGEETSVILIKVPEDIGPCMEQLLLQVRCWVQQIACAC